MDDWVSVFEGNRLAAHGLAEALERERLHVFEQHEAGFAADVHARPAVTRVLVPPEERERAERVATHWQTHHTLRVQGLTGRLARVFATSLLAPALWWGGAVALPERLPTLGGAEPAGGLGSSLLATDVTEAAFRLRTPSAGCAPAQPACASRLVRRRLFASSPTRRSGRRCSRR
jgi:hypothetical protein